MARRLSSLILSLLLLLPSAALHAELVLGAPFRDGAILQRGKPVPIWGSSVPGDEVQVDFHGQTKRTVADEHGKWLLKLDGLEASAAPANLVVKGRETVTVKDVLVGEVWLCSGQSNMMFFLRQAADAQREIAEAQYPLIRQFTVNGVVSDEPQAMAGGEWKTCSPATAGDFTAVGYFFARDLHRQLGVPIGIIKATLGGSPIEGWLSAESLASDPAFAVVATRWTQLKARVKPGDRNQPAGLYNGLIRPMEPYALAGFVWYQGEGNHERANEYQRLLASLIAQDRRGFGSSDLPFLLVQLPNYTMPQDRTGRNWAWVREAQAAAAQSNPHVGMAVTIDVGDPADAHPTNKQLVGARLALVALAKVYGRSLEDSGPVVVRSETEGATVRVHFDHAAGLHFIGDPNRTFEIAGDDRNFVPALAKIEGETVMVSAPTVPHPVAVRLNWSNAPEACLANGSGLPAAPFRTDRW